MGIIVLSQCVLAPPSPLIPLVMHSSEEKNSREKRIFRSLREAHFPKPRCTKPPNMLNLHRIFGHWHTSGRECKSPHLVADLTSRLRTEYPSTTLVTTTFAPRLQLHYKLEGKDVHVRQAGVRENSLHQSWFYVSSRPSAAIRVNAARIVPDAPLTFVDNDGTHVTDKVFGPLLRDWRSAWSTDTLDEYIPSSFTGIMYESEDALVEAVQTLLRIEAGW